MNCECELSRVAPGDMLVTRVAGPALSPHSAACRGVVAELGGSTSHLASLARERGIPMVLGVLDATRTIPGRRPVAVDGVAGIVRWIGEAKPRIFVTQPIAESALKRLRALGSVKVFPDDSRIIPHSTLVAAVTRRDILFCLLHDKIDRAVIAANPKLRHIAAQSISPSNIDVAEATARGIPVTVVPPVTTEATADLALRADARGGAPHGGRRPAGARRKISRRAIAASARLLRARARPSG